MAKIHISPLGKSLGGLIRSEIIGVFACPPPGALACLREIEERNRNVVDKRSTRARRAPLSESRRGEQASRTQAPTSRRLAIFALRPSQASQGRQEEVESKEKNNTERRFQDVYIGTANIYLTNTILDSGEYKYMPSVN